MSKFWLWVHKNVEKAVIARGAEANQILGSISDVKIGTSKRYSEVFVDSYIGRDEKCTAENFGSQNGFTFQVYPGLGGAVVKRTKYDVTRDRHDYTLYIVADGDDVAAEIGKIVSMEMMRGE